MLTEDDVRRIAREEIAAKERRDGQRMAVLLAEMRAQWDESTRPEPGDGPLKAEIKAQLREDLLGARDT